LLDARVCHETLAVAQSSTKRFIVLLAELTESENASSNVLFDLFLEGRYLHFLSVKIKFPFALWTKTIVTLDDLGRRFQFKAMI